MAKTSLDDLYTAWIATPCDRRLNDLLYAVRAVAMKSLWQFRAEADDLAQHLTTLVWQKLNDFQPDGRPLSFTRWISTITRRTRLDAYKKQIPTSDGLIEHAVEDHHYIDIADLPADMKEVATSLLHGYSIKDTAQRMNLKEGTLRKRLHAFRQR